MINTLSLPFFQSFPRPWSNQATTAEQIEQPDCALHPPAEPARQLPQRQLHQAFQRTYQRFAQAYPAWVQQGFTEEWLRPALLQPLFRQGGNCADSAYFLLPTARELVEQWDKRSNNQGGGAEPVAVRVQRQVELLVAADDLLLWLQDEMRQNEGQRSVLVA